MVDLENNILPMPGEDEFYDEDTTFILSVDKNLHNLTHCPTSNEKADCDFNCPWSGIRLPVFYRPEHYVLNLRPDLDTDEFFGDVTISIFTPRNQDNLESKNWLILHSKDLTINEVAVEQNGLRSKIDAKDWRTCTKNEQLAFKLSSDFKGNFSLFLDFKGNLSNKLDGLYKSYYMAEDGKTKKYLITTQFEPTSARKMFPCFDEPSFKAHFTLNVVHDSNLMTLSNAPLLNSSTINVDGRSLIKDSFDKTVKMSTYLLAVIVSDYKRVTSKSLSGIIVSVYAPPHQVNLTDYALNISVKSLDFFEQFFGVPYPLKKLDLISINDFQAGAMENWGLVTFRDIYLLHEPKKAAAVNEENIVGVIVHELSHQMSNFVSDCLESALWLDGLVNTHPVSSEIVDPSEIESMFDDISYSKGASLIRYLMSIIGADDLRSGLQDYLTSFKYSNAEEKDLWVYLNKHTNRFPNDLTVAKFMKHYIQRKGYPLVEISVNNGRLLANQTRFYYLIGEMNNQTRNETWNIPITFITDNLDEPKTFWVEHQKEVNIDTGIKGFSWFKVNVNSTGYYRVNYDDSNWKALFKAMVATPKFFTSADRMGLLSDAFALLDVGKMKFGLLFDALREILNNEQSRGVWDIVNMKIRLIETRLRESETYSAFSKMMVSILEKPYSTVGWNYAADKHESIFVSIFISKMACLFNVNGCRKRAVETFKNFTENGQSLNPNFRYLSCSHGLSEGPDTHFDKVFNLYNKSEVPAEKMDFLLCLASTKSFWRLSSLSQPIISRIIRSFKILHSQFDYDEFVEFLKNKELGSSKRPYEQTKERIRINVQFLDLHEKNIAQYLRKLSFM
uniref:Aminopeptidase n=1 Tax=Romanomermis culicivorax TaxID=13658 RepID=A0A915IPG6_ROMCU